MTRYLACGNRPRRAPGDRTKTRSPAVETDNHVTSAEFARAATEEATDALIAKGAQVRR
jgi:hypothetical protein